MGARMAFELNESAFDLTINYDLANQRTIMTICKILCFIYILTYSH